MGGTAGAVISAVGAVLGIIVSVLLGWFIKRTDRNSRMARASLQDQEYVLRLVSVMRDDYWSLVDYAYSLLTKYRNARTLLSTHGESIPEARDIPTPKHRQLEARHTAGEPLDEDEDQ